MTDITAGIDPIRTSRFEIGPPNARLTRRNEFATLTFGLSERLHCRHLPSALSATSQFYGRFAKHTRQFTPFVTLPGKGEVMPNIGKWILSNAIAFAFFGVNTFPAVAQVPVDVVAKTGDQAPGTPIETTFTGLGLPKINNAGEVIFNSNLTGTGVTSANNYGIWAGLPGAAQLLVRAGDPAPGTAPGVTF